MVRKTTAIAMAAALAIGAGVARGQQPPAAAAGESATVTRVYDVRDLTVVAPSYPIGGSLVPPTRIATPAAAAAAAAAGQGSGGGGQQQVAMSPPADAARPPTPLDAIRTLVESSVDPQSWKDNGGDRGTFLATDGGLLFVTQTPAAQDRVAALLSDLRKGRTAMVRVRADWVVLPPGQVAKLFRAGPADRSAVPEVDRDALARLPASVPHYAASVSCLSGQTVHLASGPARTMVTNATPVVAPGAVAYDAQQTLVQYGLTLQVTATVGGGDGTATLDLTSVASQPAAAAALRSVVVTGAASTTRPATITADSVTVSGPPVEVTAANSGIDRFAAVVQQVRTTAVVPVGRPVLVGGMTLDPGGTAGELYLVVEADVGK